VLFLILRGRRVLHKLLYNGSNWDKSEAFGECGHTLTYTPNGIATIDWQQGRIHGIWILRNSDRFA
jgi:Na+/glutamate symporter